MFQVPVEEMVANRVKAAHYAIRDPAVLNIVKELKAQGRDVIELNIGDPGGRLGAYGFQTPKHIVDAYVAALKSGENDGYATSQGDQFIRKAIAEDSKRRGIKDADENNVITGQGVSELIRVIFSTFLQKGRNVVLPRPNYPLYGAMANYFDGEARFYDLDPENDWATDPQQIGSLVDEKTATVVVINPNNPTGSVLDEGQLREIIAVVGKKGKNKVPIIADEIYHEVSRVGDVTAMASLTAEVPIFTFDGLSKNHYAPGYRMGSVLISNMGHLPAEYLSTLKDNMVKQTGFGLSASNPAQYAYAAALELRSKNDAVYQEHLKKINERAEYSYNRLKAIPGISVNMPKGAFYIFPRLKLENAPWKTDKEFQLDLLKTTGVLIVPGSGFGMKPEDLFFRIVTLPTIEVQKQAYDRLEQFVKSKTG